MEIFEVVTQGGVHLETPPLASSVSCTLLSTCSLSERPQPLSSTTLSTNNPDSFPLHPQTWFKRFTSTAPGPVLRSTLMATASPPTPTARLSVRPPSTSTLSIHMQPADKTCRALRPHQLRALRRRCPQDRRELPRSLHWREGLRLLWLQVPPCHP